MITWKDAMHEYRLMNSGDAWGDTMSAWFSVASELHNRGESVPSDWQYRPSPISGDQEVDDIWQDLFADMNDDEILRFGRVLHRYAAILKRAGKDY